jgi:predicted NodU family carbamoyl transferase
LNVGGKPICGTKANALQVLCDTGMNTLVYGDEIING